MLTCMSQTWSPRNMTRSPINCMQRWTPVIPFAAVSLKLVLSIFSDHLLLQIFHWFELRWPSNHLSYVGQNVCVEILSTIVGLKGETRRPVERQRIMGYAILIT